MKKNRTQKGVLLMIVVFFTFSIHAQVTFHVSPRGNDSNSGTAAQPLASILGARNAIRAYKKEHSAAVSFVVSIADGSYSMNETFVLTPKDRGTLEHPIVYKAEKGAKPIFSGGEKISGFKVNENGIWEVKIPESSRYNWRFQQLYVNAKRATLARTPNTGFLKIERVQETVWEKGTGRTAKKAQQVLMLQNKQLTALEELSGAERELLRFRTYHKWDFTIRHLDEVVVTADSIALVTSGQGMKPWNPIKKGGRLVLENYAAALDTAGEWFLNTEGVLFYKPLAGQTPENTEVIAPVLESLVAVEGDSAQNNFVEYISFEGLAFTHCHYRIPTSGFEPNQAAIAINAAVMLNGARHINFLNCEISFTGQHALWFGEGCSHSSVTHSYLHELGGGGIYLGSKAALEGAGHTQHIKLHNNIIQTGGQEFPPAVGIWVGHSSDNEITNNDIANFYYTGISIGWVWGYAPSLSKRNKVAYNRIHHIGWDLLSDMAAVYTLGASEGTVINNNIIHDIHAYSYGGWGLYTDEGSSGIVMENNLVYNTKTGGFHQHYGKENVIRNNVFAYAKMYQLQCTRVEEHRSFDFTNNIIVFKEGMVLQGAWNTIDIEMDYNMYWNSSATAYDFNGASFKKWQQTGYDAHSFVGNPNFRDAPNFDFRLKNKKAIAKINFTPIDYSKIGVYGSDLWLQKAVLPTQITDDFKKAVAKNMNPAPQ